MRTSASVNLGFHHLLIYNVDLEKWCEKYDLKPFTGKCMDCGRQLEVIHPFAGKNRRGLRAKSCPCGNHHVPFSFVDLNYDELNLNSLGTSIANSNLQDSEESIQKAPLKLKLVDTSY